MLYAYKILQNALTLLRIFGSSDLFITFTANPAWTEIIDALLPGQSASDRPDIVAHVFHLKCQSLLDDIVKRNVFGKTVAYVYTIEYQKRGLPHMHLIVFLHPSSQLSSPSRIDSFISAEFPDRDREPILFDVVTKFMVHGPCRQDQCLDGNGHCNKHFPNPFKETELSGESYVKMKRRNTGQTYVVCGSTVDNRMVIPYSPYLLRRYCAHINVECTTGLQAIKYIYKVRIFSLYFTCIISTLFFPTVCLQRT